MRFYRLLLLLCPAGFRHEYGGEMAAVHARRLRDASPAGRIWVWLDAVSDVVLGAAGAHFDLLRQDLRYARRAAAQAPGFTATVVAVAALGVAASTAVFSLADHVLLRALPFPEPARLVKLWEDQSSTGYSRMDVSPANYRDWKRMSRSFQAMGAYRQISVNMSGAGDPERLAGVSVSGELFPALGVAPALGRTIAAAEDGAGAAGTVVLSHALWQSRFAADPGVIGRTLQLDGEPFTVIGVMPASFHFPHRAVRFWTALRFAEDDYADRGNNSLEVVARLRAGGTRAEALAELRVVASRLAAQYPKENGKIGITLVSMRDEISWRSRALLGLLAAAALFVLLVAVANLANLLLARAAGRSREMAVRTALGAGRDRLARQMLTESLVLALAGGVTGLLLAAAAVPLLSRLVPNGLPIAGTPALDWRVLVFSFAATLLTGIACGALPALRTHSGGLGLRSGAGVRRDAVRRALVVTQVAASVTLLVSTGLLLRALARVENTDPGFSPSSRLIFRTALPLPRYAETAVRERYYSAVLDELRALPQVRSAAVISYRPMGDFRGGVWPLLFDGRPGPGRAVARFVTPGYFATMRIPLLHGRDFTTADRPTSLRAAVVSRSFVEHQWPGETGLGRTFSIPFGNLQFTITGVVGDVRFRGLERESEPQMYFAHAQCPDNAFVFFTPKDFIVETAGDPAALAAAVRRIVARIDPAQPVSGVQTLADVVGEDAAPRRVQLGVMGAFAGACFLLAAVGLHGLLAFAVGQRRQEIGVRRALGAPGRSIAALVLGEAALLAGLGGALGLGAAWWTGRVLQGFLFGVSPGDAPTHAAALALAILMTLCGALVPALRALRIDPAAALRAE